MPDTIKTIGTGQDYADPLLWAAAVGNLDDGNRQVGEVVEDTDVGGFWRPNQSWPNGGLLRGNVEITGELGQGITLRNDGDATRFCLSPSSNLHFQDFHLLRTSGYNFQGMKSNVFTRVVMPNRGNLIDPNEAPQFYHCVVQDFLANAQSALISTIKFYNSVATSRLTVKDYNTLEFVNSISVATDWALGPNGTYPGVDTLVTDSYIRQNANAGEFGAGSSGYTVNYDATNDFVDFAGGDYRLKSDSAPALIGVGPFTDGGGDVEPPLPSGYNFYYNQNFSTVINNA